MRTRGKVKCFTSAHKNSLDEFENSPNNVVDYFNCPFCSEVFTQPEQLIQHLPNHETQFPKVSPEEAYSSEEESNLEDEDEENENDQENISADSISSTTEDDDDVEEEDDCQMDTEIKKANYWSCVICEETFSRSYDLQTHMDKHTGYKPFKCPKCNDRFAEVEAVESHLRAAHNLGEDVSLLKLLESSKSTETRMTRRMRSLWKNTRTSIQKRKRGNPEVSSSILSAVAQNGDHAPVKKKSSRALRSCSSSVAALRNPPPNLKNRHRRKKMGDVNARKSLEKSKSGEKVPISCESTREATTGRLGSSSHIGKGSTKPLNVKLPVQEQSFPCPFCSEIFFGPDYLINHLSTHEEAAKLDLDINFGTRKEEEEASKQKLMEETNLTVEQSVKHGLLRPCTIKLVRCDGNMELGSATTRIRKRVAFDDQLLNSRDDAERQRQEAEKRFVVKILLDDGRIRYKCSFCNKIFNHRANAIRHTRAHTGIKPYGCPQCGKRFARRGNLKCHIQLHTGEKPFGCQQCGKRFSLQANLKCHYITHTGKKPYGCQQCGKRFSLQKNLKRHIQLHTGEKPYACQQCGKRFSLQASLKRHNITHTGEKAYECQQCGKRFALKSTLKRHLQIHTE